MKRWMAVAAMGLAALGGIVTQGPARASSAAWYQVYQSGFTGSFMDSAAISRSNIWAVGDTYTAAGKQVYTPFIRHFNGSSWQAITIPNGSGSASEWVAASAGNNVWVGGHRNSSGATFISSVVYRWNGARWGKVPLPAQTTIGGHGGIAVLAPNNVWALASSGTVTDQVFHWNGSKWQYYFSNGMNFVAMGISAPAANNVWVSGFSYSKGKPVAAAYHWNGSAWHPVSMPHPVIELDGGPHVTAVSPANVWIGYETTSQSYALHWNGSHWSTITGSYTYDIVADGKGGYWFGPQAILTGSTWTSVQLPEVSGGFGFVTRIPGTTSFLMSAGVMKDNSSPEKPTLYRFDL
jgi:hypothetical protein